MNKTQNYPNKIPIIGRVRMCVEAVTSLSIKDKTIINVGCSFGWLEKFLSNRGAKFIGIDPDLSAISFARKNSKGKFLVGSALKLPVDSQLGDIVLFFDVIEHLPQGQEPEALKEINRVIKKSGVLILTTPNNHFWANILDPAWYFGHRHYEKMQLQKLLLTQGFEITDHKIVGNFLAPIYTIWFYLIKHIFKKSQPRSPFMEKISDNAYMEKRGIIEHLIFARKLKSVS